MHICLVYATRIADGKIFQCCPGTEPGVVPSVSVARPPSWLLTVMRTILTIKYKVTSNIHRKLALILNEDIIY